MCTVALLAGAMVGSAAAQSPTIATQHDAAIEAYLAKPPNDWAAVVDSIHINPGAVIVRGHAERQRPSNWRLAELRLPHAVEQPARAERILPLQWTDDGRFSAALPRIDNGFNRALSRWAVVAANEEEARFEQVSAARYAAPLPNSSAQSNATRRQPLSRKGLAGVESDASLADAVELGVHNVTVNVKLDHLLALPETTDVLKHEYGGRTYPIDRRGVARLDRIVGFAQAHDMIVSFIILSPRLPASDPRADALTHPDATEGYFSMANVATEKGVAAYAALLDFLAYRYGRPGEPLGGVDNWIVHNEVNSGWIWTNAGQRGLGSYADLLIRSLRIVDSITRSHSAGARTFVSLDHCWTTPHVPTDSHFYAGRDVLDAILAWCRAEGDFPWGVAFHPYPQDLLNPAIWNDDAARDDAEAPVVTFKNIGVLISYLDHPERRWRGEPRPVLLSEQGFHTPDYSEASQDLQSRAMRYAWRQIKPYPTIEAFHYHRWMDHPDEGGLKCGLRMFADPATGEPGDKKSGWYTWQALGSEH